MSDNVKIDAKLDLKRDELKQKEKPKESNAAEFQRLLDQHRVQPQATTRVTAQNATEYAIRERRREEERKPDDRKHHEEREREKKNEPRTSEEKRDARTAEQKVIAKGSSREGKQQGSSEGGSHGFGGHEGKRRSEMLSKLENTKSSPVSLTERFEQKLKELLHKTPEAPRMTQAILDKVVQYVRIGVTKTGEKAIAIELHKTWFHGLKLQVVTKEGKVSVLFATRDARSKQIFEENREAIASALSQKGIQVDEIVVS